MTIAFKTELSENRAFFAGIMLRLEEATDTLIGAREPRNSVRAKRKLTLCVEDLHDALSDLRQILADHNMVDLDMLTSSSKLAFEGAEPFPAMSAVRPMASTRLLH